MAKAKPLSAKQLAVIDDLFGGELDERAVLDKYKISRKLYNRWLTDPAFAVQLDRAVMAAYRRSALFVARNAPLAAEKLVALATNEKGETARKACIDIISMHTPAVSLPVAPVVQSDNRTDRPQITPETAGIILAVLAEEKTLSKS